MDLPLTDKELRKIVSSLEKGELREKLELVLHVKQEHSGYKKILREKYGMVI